jgi:large subunit ribosomal protein L3
MTFILARKLKMTSIFAENGEIVPVTILEAGPCKVTQVRASEKDGYAAVQIGYGATKHATKSEAGHLKDLPAFRHLAEFRVEKTEAKRGDEVSVTGFEKGTYVDVTATSRGKGTAGVIKRHHFAGGPASHGSQSHRIGGSTGQRFPQHTIKGKRMAGRMGNERVTVRNLEVVDIDAERNLLVVRGAIPGHYNTIVRVKSAVAPRKGAPQ